MAEEQKLEVEEPVVGWVVWKDAETEMVVLGDGDGQPRLFTSYAAAKWEQGSLDVVAPVTQRRYDELCGKKIVLGEAPQPVKDDPVEDPHEAWVLSILAKLDERNSRSSKRAVKTEPVLPKEVVKPVPAPPEREVDLDRIVTEKEARRRGVRDGEVSAEGFVYLLLADGLADMYKIGYSTDPVRRLKTIQASCPVPLSLEWVIPCWGNDGTELKIHRKFAEQREEGEWFRLSREDVEWIQGLRRGYRVRS